MIPCATHGPSGGGASAVRASVLALLCAGPGCLGQLEFPDDAGADRDTGLVPVDAGDLADEPDNPALDVGPGDSGGTPTDDGGRDDATPTPLVLADVVREVFLPACSPCHTDRVSGGLSLLDRATLHDTLLAPAVQAPGVARVRPGDPDGSYLWRKLMGTHEEIGGIGETMPLSGSLSETQLELVERWIRDGALR